MIPTLVVLACVAVAWALAYHRASGLAWSIALAAGAAALQLRTAAPGPLVAAAWIAVAVFAAFSIVKPLRRAVENIVRNAVSFTTPAGIALTAQRVAAEGRLTVRDHGPGVPDGMKERIFEPYVTTRSGGTGLGLALARQTILAHGGRLTVAGAPGGGAAVGGVLPGAP